MPRKANFSLPISTTGKGAYHVDVPPSRCSGDVEAILVHQLAPRRHEVFRKLLLRVGARIDFREGTELRVRTEDQIDTGGDPLDLVRLPVAPLEHVSRAI